MTGWYVASTHARQEARAEENLRRQNFHVWVPSFTRLRRHARRVDSARAPLFPGYLFIRFDPAHEPWSAINSTFGVRSLICRNDAPVQLPDGFVQGLRAEMDSGDFILPEDRLDPGDKVCVTDGPFAQSVGKLLSFAPRDRVMLLLNMLGRDVPVAVPRWMVVPAF
jgi:transcriptional antiterminator RfaH